MGYALLFFFVVIYFIPTWVAIDRKKADKGAIFALNLFLGWTFVGWVIALVWSLKRTNQ